MLIVSVTEKGTLESADNRDMICKVRAGNKGFATTINWVIDDGTRVKPGQLLMVLDDSALDDQEETQSITVKKALRGKVQAEKDYEIRSRTTRARSPLAETALTAPRSSSTSTRGWSRTRPDSLAAVAGMPSTLTEDGDYRQKLDDLTGQIPAGGESTVEQNRERAAWADRMVKLTYMSRAQAQAEKVSSRQLHENRSVAFRPRKSILISHDRIRTMTTANEHTRQRTPRAGPGQVEAEANEVQTRTTTETTTVDILPGASRSSRHPASSERNVRSRPRIDIIDGSMVVYFKNESNRFGSINTGPDRAGCAR